MMTKKRPIHIVHVVESFGAGTLSALSCICQNTSGLRHTIIYSPRLETPESYEDLFPKDTRFYLVPMCRAIHPIHDGRALWGILKTLQTLKPDIVHCHSSKAGVLGRIAALICGLPSVYTPHGYSFQQTGILPVQRILYMGIEAFCSLFGTAIAACGQEEASLARRIAPRKKLVAWINNAVDLDALASVAPAPRASYLPLVGISGRCIEQRNPELFASLARHFEHESQWMWIGARKEDYPDFPGNTVLTGWLSRKQSLTRLASLDIYIQTSRWEGLSISVLEAMALGKPVVASNIPSNQAVIKHGVTGFLAADHEEFVAFLRRLIASPTLRREMGDAGKKRVADHYNIPRSAREYAALYAIVLERHARS